MRELVTELDLPVTSIVAIRLLFDDDASFVSWYHKKAGNTTPVCSPWELQPPTRVVAFQKRLELPSSLRVLGDFSTSTLVTESQSLSLGENDEGPHRIVLNPVAKGLERMKTQLTLSFEADPASTTACCVLRTVARVEAPYVPFMSSVIEETMLCMATSSVSELHSFAAEYVAAWLADSKPWPSRLSLEPEVVALVRRLSSKRSRSGSLVLPPPTADDSLDRVLSPRAPGSLETTPRSGRVLRSSVTLTTQLEAMELAMASDAAAVDK